MTDRIISKEMEPYVTKLRAPSLTVLKNRIAEDNTDEKVLEFNGLFLETNKGMYFMAHGIIYFVPQEKT